MQENYNKDSHSFSVQLAKEIGLEEALILHHLYYWCYSNSDNKDMIKNGYVWVYITRKKIEETYPYLTNGKIRGTIKKLEEEGYIVIDCFNKLAIDKTNWYALTDKAYSHFGTSLAKLTNDKLNSPTNCKNSQAIQSIEKEYNKEIDTIVSTKNDEPNGAKANANIEDRIDYQEVLDKWREICPMLTQPRMLNNMQKRKLRALLKNNDATIDDLYKCFRIIASSSFCLGVNDRKWSASLMWLVNDTKFCFNSLLEGKYSSRHNDKLAYEHIIGGELKKPEEVKEQKIVINGIEYK